MTAINRDEWLKALSEAGIHDDEDDQSATTIAEFSALIGIPKYTAARKLELLEKAGKATRTKKWSYTPGGRRVKMLAFKLP